MHKYADVRIDEAAALHWPADVPDRMKMVMPGDNVEMECELHTPLAIETGQRFNIREGTYISDQQRALLNPSRRSYSCYRTCHEGHQLEDFDRIEDFGV